MDNKEPYRATRLWNEVIAAFQSGMPVKKHRRRIQTYNNCFTASEAVTWLHCYLMNNPNFGTDVTREQTINFAAEIFKVP
ncbi:DEP domain-containing protein 1A [Caerostris extrusa]|uniref:DEP domain-containing protein 1A n=1 Tax=Caerostris extrusa TaxID=172846 RepID=A0AAV4WFX5_CAEEX|nr:DEP domain-containing protein 1A [Caerostris extrusa]